MGSDFQFGPEDLIRAAQKVGKDLPPSPAKAYLGILDFPLIDHARAQAPDDNQEKEKATQAEILRQLKNLGILHFF